MSLRQFVALLVDEYADNCWLWVHSWRLRGSRRDGSDEYGYSDTSFLYFHVHRANEYANIVSVTGPGRPATGHAPVQREPDVHPGNTDAQRRSPNCPRLDRQPK